MGGLGISDVTHGYSMTGAADFRAKLNDAAITQTAQKLTEINGIKITNSIVYLIKAYDISKEVILIRTFITNSFSIFQSDFIATINKIEI